MISTGQSIDASNAWRTSRERTEIQEQIDTLLDTPTEYEVYEYLWTGDVQSEGNLFDPKCLLRATNLSSLGKAKKRKGEIVMYKKS